MTRDLIPSCAWKSLKQALHVPSKLRDAGPLAAAMDASTLDSLYRDVLSGSALRLQAGIEAAADATLPIEEPLPATDATGGAAAAAAEAAATHSAQAATTMPTMPKQSSVLPPSGMSHESRLAWVLVNAVYPENCENLLHLVCRHRRGGAGPEGWLGQLRVLLSVLDAMAPTQARLRFLNACDNGGNTALHCVCSIVASEDQASADQRPVAFATLLIYGADPWILNDCRALPTSLDLSLYDNEAVQALVVLMLVRGYNSLEAVDIFVLLTPYTNALEASAGWSVVDTLALIEEVIERRDIAMTYSVQVRDRVGLLRRVQASSPTTSAVGSVRGSTETHSGEHEGSAGTGGGSEDSEGSVADIQSTNGGGSSGTSQGSDRTENGSVRRRKRLRLG